jgi:hypothetical protein
MTGAGWLCSSFPEVIRSVWNPPEYAGSKKLREGSGE